MLLRTCSRCCLRLQMHRDWSGLCHLGSALTYRDIHAHSRHTESLPPGGDPPRLRESNRQGQTAPAEGVVLTTLYCFYQLKLRIAVGCPRSSRSHPTDRKPVVLTLRLPEDLRDVLLHACDGGLLTTTTSSSAGTSVAGAGTFSATASTTGSGVGITKTVPTSGAASATGADAARDAPATTPTTARSCFGRSCGPTRLSTADTSSAAESTTGTSWCSAAAGVSIGRSCCRSALLDASSPEDTPAESDSVESAATVSSSSW